MDIKIGKSSRTCVTCEKEFKHEEELRSTVRFEDGVLVRADWCTACWNEECALGAYSTWSPQFYDPRVAEAAPPEPRLTLGDQSPNLLPSLGF